MIELKDLEFKLSEKGKGKGKFSPKENIDILFPYFVERVRQEGVVDLQKIAIELAKRFDVYETKFIHPLYSTAELVSPQFGLQTIRVSEAVRRAYPNVEETKGFQSCRVNLLLYREESSLLEYIKFRTVKRNIVRVELKEGGGK